MLPCCKLMVPFSTILLLDISADSHRDEHFYLLEIRYLICFSDTLSLDFFFFFLIPQSLFPGLLLHLPIWRSPQFCPVLLLFLPKKSLKIFCDTHDFKYYPKFVNSQIYISDPVTYQNWSGRECTTRGNKERYHL